MLTAFLSTFLLSVLVIGVVSYWSSFELYKETALDKLQIKMDQIASYQTHVDQRMSRALAQAELLRFIKQHYPNEILLTAGDGTVLIQPVSAKDKGLFSQEIAIEEHLKWGWTVRVTDKVAPFSAFFVEMQKYTLLAVVMTAIVIVQFVIFLSHHFTSPLKNLARSMSHTEIQSYPALALSKRRDEIGKLNNAFVAMIERLKISENRRLKMQKLQKNIIESASFGIISKTVKPESVFTNQAAQRMIAKEKQRGANLFNEALKVMHQSWESKEPIHHIYRHERDGELITVIEMHTSFLMDEHNEHTGVLCNLQDITEKTNVEKKMIRLGRLASLGELSAGVAHEIRNPLAGIKASTQVLQKRLPHDIRKETNAFMSRIVREIDRLNKIVTDLLDFAKPKQAKPVTNNLSEVISNVLLMLAKPVANKGIIIKRNEDVSLSFIFDHDQLTQIVLNLLMNAIHASEHGGVIIITSGYKGKRPFFAIQDFGRGIAEEHMDKLFNPFFSTHPQGTGLGLAIVHRLVEQNDAEIDVYSDFGTGTTFQVVKKQQSTADYKA